MVNDIVSSNSRILLIDDTKSIHEDFRKLLSSGGVSQSKQELDMLEADLFADKPEESLHKPQQVFNESFELDSAYQGEDGVLKVKQSIEAGKPYAMAFVDVRMPPGIDGIETIRRIWEIDPHLQVVICTAYSDYSWSDTVKKLGQNDRYLILKKPFDSVEVVQFAHAQSIKWNLIHENNLYYETLKRETCFIQLLQMMTTSLMRVQSRHEAIDAGGHLLAHYNSFNFGHAYERDESGAVVIKDLYYLDKPEILKEFKSSVSALPLSFINDFFESPDIKVINDIEYLKDLPVYSFLKEHHVKNCIFMPVSHQGVVQFLYVFYAQKVIDQDDVFRSYLSNILDQISLACSLFLRLR